ncbi:MAG: Hsp20/alpha crystallin family protein [Anaerolineae bacterium]|nr:Hsp20/alpha crystallin family protein [Anaerolineae bacterium]
MIVRRYAIPNAWDELGRMQRDLDQMMRAFVPDRGRVTPVFPAMNAWTNEDGEIVTAEIPGIDPSAIEISVVNDVLTISGERALPELAEGERYHRRERMNGKFTRSIQLAFPVNVDKVDASYENGVLTIALPRAEADRPRKIAVKNA